jgi:hypothetical protein
MIYSTPDFDSSEVPLLMRPIKAFLFVVYCTAAVAVVSVMFSQVWRSSRQVSAEMSILNPKQTPAAPLSAALPVVQNDSSQS